MRTEYTTPRPLVEADIPAAMRLKDAAGWNQTGDDWRAFLALTPTGCFALEENGVLVATSTAMPHGDRFGWIGMVLVDPDHRRRGHGTRMLLHARAFLETRGVVAALDATPEGKTVYDRLGFEEISRIQRWTATAPDVASVTSRGDCESPPVADIDDALELDLDSFGAPRAGLLRMLAARDPSLFFLHRSRGEVDGFVLGRRGSRFTQIGPCVARNEGVALELLGASLDRLAGQRVAIDVPTPSPRIETFLRSRSFEVERPLIRMVQVPVNDPSAPGATTPGGRTDRIFAITGPEWG